MNENPVTTKEEAQGVLTNIMEGLYCTDAYQERDVNALLAMVEADVQRYLIEQFPWAELRDCDHTECSPRGCQYRSE